jgi:2-polyprenyl-3-methyl-5-hydroxy-6-metoxy-1,4-benzoquinol methylase
VAQDYDRLFTESLIGCAQRESVWKVAKRVFRPGQRILELNCGTGVDALFLAGLGCQVLALDGSPSMVTIARERVLRAGIQSQIEVGCLAIEELSALGTERRYDAVFSNFGGMNCVADLNAVGRALASLVKPRGQMLLCLLNRFCLWETTFYLTRFRFERAFRRWRRDGVQARIGAATLKVYYPSTTDLTRALRPHFKYLQHRAVGLTIPPSYLESWVQRYPQFLAIAKQLDARQGGWPLLRSLGDHYVVHFARS